MLTQDAIIYEASRNTLICRDHWTLEKLPVLQAFLKKIVWPTAGELYIDSQQIETMDSAGAWLLFSVVHTLKAHGVTATFLQLSETQATLRALITPQMIDAVQIIPREPNLPWLPKLGKNAIALMHDVIEYFSFLGVLAHELCRTFSSPKKWRIKETAGIIYRSGYQALPIIAMLSFMIGVVITYQLGLQLRNYGANRYIVDLLGLAILREFGPLITAIMVAGRTGSAFTAQLGMMKINQEIDALNTMGVTPSELLLLPRIFGLFIALPLLTFWANIFGVLGGMLMANNMLHVTWHDFLQRFPRVIPTRNIFIGLGKAPLFALVIASIGCFQGMKVEDNANQIGLNTTRSVVLSIFFIIVIDAILSIIFSKLKL